MSEDDDIGARSPESVAEAAERTFLATPVADRVSGRFAPAMTLRTLETLRDRDDEFARAAAALMMPQALRLLVAQAAVELRSIGRRLPFGNDEDERALAAVEAGVGDDAAMLYIASAAIPSTRRRSWSMPSPNCARPVGPMIGARTRTSRPSRPAAKCIVSVLADYGRTPSDPNAHFAPRVRRRAAPGELLPHCYHEPCPDTTKPAP